MIDWLSDWLRNIIAVILLAVFVELLMPNKAMLRYARLVVGLFVLLTIMSPVLKLIQGNQGDLEQSLAGSFRLWNSAAAGREVRMPSLQDIEREAEKLSGEREQGARRLTERTLEEAIVRQIAESTGTIAAGADVRLDDAGQRVEAVVITMGTEPESEETSSASADPPKRVESVTVDIEVDPVKPAGGETESAEEEGADGPDEAAWEPVSAALDGSIRKLLQQNFGIDPGLVTIRRPADDGRKS